MTCVWLSQVVPRADGAIDGRSTSGAGQVSGYAFTVDASVVEQLDDTIIESCQSSMLYQSTVAMSNADRAEAAARHCDQLAQVLFAARGAFPRNPLRKSHLRTPYFTNLFGLQHNLRKQKSDKVFELYNNYVEAFERQSVCS